MPDLPTLTVTSTQADRILAAFKARYGTTTQAATTTAYKKELARWVRNIVVTEEGNAFSAQQSVDFKAHLDSINSALPDPDTVV